MKRYPYVLTPNKRAHVPTRRWPEDRTTRHISKMMRWWLIDRKIEKSRFEIVCLWWKCALWTNACMNMHEIW
jgi:hypothetical protein